MTVIDIKARPHFLPKDLRACSTLQEHISSVGVHPHTTGVFAVLHTDFGGFSNDAKWTVSGGGRRRLCCVCVYFFLLSF